MLAFFDFVFFAGTIFETGAGCGSWSSDSVGSSVMGEFVSDDSDESSLSSGMRVGDTVGVAVVALQARG